ncbi:MAG: 30S ribosome-binding factor RbfA [Bacteroidota bacterium]|nr:30S ribosome-binding factor RbfA [Bacteroidota bacterium]
MKITLSKGIIMANENSEKNMAKMLNIKLKNSVFLNCNVIFAMLNKFFIRRNKVNIVDELFYKTTNTMRYCDQLISFSKFATFMSIRREKVANVIRKELGVFFQKNASSICMGAMVSVTTVRMSPDLSIAKVYLSIFGGKDNDEVFEKVHSSSKFIRHQLSQIVKNQLRRTPELHFYRDDSLDYAEKIEELLK